MTVAHAQLIPSAIASDESLLTRVGSHLAGASVVAVDWLRQTLCGLSGHDMLRRFEAKRLSLQCMSCGHTTSGWALREQP
jgi:hypothetical protein